MRKTVFAIFVLVCVAVLLLLPSVSTAAPQFKLKYAHVQPDKHATNLSALWMAEELKKRSGGRIEMAVYPGSVLGRPNDMLDSLQVGDLDFAWISSAELAPSIKEFNVFSISYLFKDSNHWKKVFTRDSPVMKRLNELTERSPYGISLVGMLGGISRQLYNSQRPVQTPADLKGLKIRVQHSPVESKIWSVLGAVPQQLAWSEIYTSLQTGVVQGAESSIDSYYQNKFYEVAHHFTFTNHQFMVLPLLMSKKTYQKLPPDLRRLVVNVAYESANYCLSVYLQSEKDTQKQLSAKGVKFTSPDPAAFQSLVAGVVKSEAAKYKAEDIVEAIKKISP